MRITRVAVLAAAVMAVAIAGCGSSSNKSTTSSSAQTAQPASSSGAYGARSSQSSTTANAALITTKRQGKLGTILAFGPKHLTVYLYEGDKRSGSSACTGACAAAWPPVTGDPRASGAAMSADLGTITRPDGAKQVTYKGHPLYLFVKDKDDGDAYGQGNHAFGADWYALAPSGSKVDQS